MAVIKFSAAGLVLLNLRGKAVVFENIEDYHSRVDDAGLDIDADSIMVLKSVGPKGYPGVAEAGNMDCLKNYQSRALPIWCVFQRQNKRMER